MSREPRGDAGNFRLRVGFAFALLLACGVGLLARAVDLQLVNQEFLIKEGDARSMRDSNT